MDLTLPEFIAELTCWAEETATAAIDEYMCNKEVDDSLLEITEAPHAGQHWQGWREMLETHYGSVKKGEADLRVEGVYDRLIAVYTTFFMKEIEEWYVGGGNHEYMRDEHDEISMYDELTYAMTRY